VGVILLYPASGAVSPRLAAHPGCSCFEPSLSSSRRKILSTHQLTSGLASKVRKLRPRGLDWALNGNGSGEDTTHGRCIGNVHDSIQFFETLLSSHTMFYAADVSHLS